MLITNPHISLHNLWYETDLNCRPGHLQCPTLPTELPHHLQRKIKDSIPEQHNLLLGFQNQSPFHKTAKPSICAENVGFEPTEPVRVLQFSRLSRSTTLPILHVLERRDSNPQGILLHQDHNLDRYQLRIYKPHVIGGD